MTGVIRGMLKCKVFSATRAQERTELGTQVTKFLEQEGVGAPQIHSIDVRQSSDSEFHCLSIVIFYHSPPKAKK